MSYEFSVKCKMRMRCDVSGCGDWATFERDAHSSEASGMMSSMMEELLPPGWTRTTRDGRRTLRCRSHSSIEGISEHELDYFRALVKSIDETVALRTVAAVRPSAILNCLIEELHRRRDLTAADDDRTAHMTASAFRSASHVDALRAAIREACDLSDTPPRAQDADWQERRRALRALASDPQSVDGVDRDADREPPKP